MNPPIRLAILAAFAVPCFAQAPDTRPSGTDVVLEIDSSRFTLDDLERLRPDLLFQAGNKFAEAERAAIENFVGQRLLEERARKEGVSIAGLLEKHVNSQIAADPSDEALRVYYEGLDTTQPFEAVRDQILQSLRERRKQRAKTAYLKTLRAEAKIEVRVPQPRLEFSLAKTPVRGPKDAPVVVVEYADYECPYCQQVEPTLLRLETEYKDRLAFSYRDSPLPMHPRAQKAGEASRCAEAQGKYWEYHDLIFASKQLEISALKQSARTLGLDGNAFDRCLDSGEKASDVKAHLTEFENLGMEGTPSFFINGRFVSGIQTYEQMKALVEEELALSSSGHGAAGQSSGGKHP
jgi:protein-disulfide isomerase